MQESTPTSPRAPGTVPGRAPRRLPDWAKLLLRAVAAAVLVGFLARRLDWQNFLALLASCDWRWWGVGCLIGLFSHIVAAVRWAALAKPIGFTQTIGTFVWRFFEGQFFSLCLPGSIGGDVVKAYRLADTTSGRLLAGCTVLADRVTGVAALGVLAGTAVAAREMSLGLAATLGAGVALLAAVMAVFRIGVGSIDRILSLIPEEHAARRFLARLLPYQMQPGLILRAIGWSFVVQIGGAVSVACIGRALGVTLPLAAWFAVVPLVALAMAVPISISGAGVREGLLGLLLAPYGVQTDAAVAVGVLWFLATIVTGLVGGILFMLEPRPAAASLPELPANT
jgi:glycosyltransferase 2 family protein